MGSISEALKNVGIGLLIGEENGQLMTVWCCTRSSERVQVDAIKVNNILPGGLNVLGLYRISDSSVQNDDDPIRPTVEALMKFLKTNRFIVFNYADQHPHSSTMLLFMYCNSGYDLDISTVPWTAVVDDDAGGNRGCFLDGHIRFRLKTQIPLKFKYEPKSDKLIKVIKTEVEELCKVISSPLTVFHVKNSCVLLFNNDEKSTNKPEEQSSTEGNVNNENGDRSPSPLILQRYQQVYSPDETCDDLYKYIEITSDADKSFIGHMDTSQKKKKKPTIVSEFQKPAISLDMFLSISSDTKTKQTPLCAPLIHQRQDDFRQVCIPLQLDVLTIVPCSYLLSQLPRTLSTAVCRQIQAAECCITEHHRQGSNFPLPKFYHIELLGSSLLLSITYPEEIDENLLEYERRHLHHLFRLPLTSPIFRKRNGVVFQEDIAALGGYLINPHVGLSSGMKAGTLHLVHGRYAYHHYMQDNFDDNKWGCAYRSLQTIISWFRFQGYTDVPVPSHREIQQVLVDIEDKPTSFVGSRQWIGSFEVGYCLDHLLNVQCRVMSVNSGVELASRGRELSMHFDGQGTPVMIGGGVLAHTILGVDYNEITGDLKFLILDPHYTGGEDLKFIQDHGWCGWKGTNFWEKNAHYNLCMPQRPVCI